MTGTFLRDPDEDSTLISLDEAERAHIEAVLKRCKGDTVEAAKILGVSRSTVYNKIQKHGIIV